MTIINIFKSQITALDISKASDRVWLANLLQNSLLLHSIQIMYFNFQISLTDEYLFSAGVIQGWHKHLPILVTSAYLRLVLFFGLGNTFFLIICYSLCLRLIPHMERLLFKNVPHPR